MSASRRRSCRFVRVAVGSVLAGVWLSGCRSQPEPVASPDGEKPARTAPKQPGDIEERAYQLRELRKVAVKVDGKAFEVWLMDTDAKREEGFMFVPPSAVKANEGMLFVLPSPQRQSFWMRNTPMPLDIAYFGEDRKLLNVMAGKPYDESALPSAGEVLYVLEVKAGTLARLGVKRGAKLEVPAGM